MKKIVKIFLGSLIFPILVLIINFSIISQGIPPLELFNQLYNASNIYITVNGTIDIKYINISEAFNLKNADINYIKIDLFKITYIEPFPNETITNENRQPGFFKRNADSASIELENNPSGGIYLHMILDPNEREANASYIGGYSFLSKPIQMNGSFYILLLADFSGSTSWSKHMNRFVSVYYFEQFNKKTWKIEIECFPWNRSDGLKQVHAFYPEYNLISIDYYGVRSKFVVCINATHIFQIYSILNITRFKGAYYTLGTSDALTYSQNETIEAKIFFGNILQLKTFPSICINDEILPIDNNVEIVFKDVWNHNEIYLFGRKDFTLYIPKSLFISSNIPSSEIREVELCIKVYPDLYAPKVVSFNRIEEEYLWQNLSCLRYMHINKAVLTINNLRSSADIILNDRLFSNATGSFRVKFTPKVPVYLKIIYSISPLELFWYVFLLAINPFMRFRGIIYISLVIYFWMLILIGIAILIKRMKWPICCYYQ
jgi:hypothetical protein